MKIVIAGGGRVGSALAARLVAEGHGVAVIDRERAVCDRLFEEIGVVAVCGDATDPSVLKQAGVGSAEIAAAVLQRDADNLAFAALARVHSTARLMARMLDGRYRDAYRLAGVHDLVAEADLVVGRMATAIEFPEVEGSLPLASGDAILFELSVAPGAVVAGMTVAQVRGQPDFPKECVFIGLVGRDGAIELPSGASVLRAGQTAILVARRSELARAIEALTAESTAEASAPLAGIAASLRRIDFLAPLSDDELAELARGVELVRRGAGEPVFKKGDPGETFYLVLAGEVALGEDPARPLELVARGGFFGEVSLLTGDPRSASAHATRESELAAIGLDDFRRVVMANPAVALEMSRILGQRLAQATKAQASRRGLFSR